MNEESRKHIAALRAELQRVLDSGDLDDDERDGIVGEGIQAAA